MEACLSQRCISILQDIREAQSHMTDGVRPLLSAPDQLSAPPLPFELTFDLGLAALCADFQENLDFRFSLGWTALVTRFIGAAGAKRALSEDVSTLKDAMRVSMATGLLSVTSRASMTVLVIGGVVWRSVGWRLLSVSLSLYGLLFLYERFWWTDASRERALKAQFVEFSGRRLRAVAPACSAACSQQVFKELSGSFSRLTQRVDLSESRAGGEHPDAEL
ncbi:Mitofusin-2 [Dissostichus eleginoides]|uniref:Mitofusin-2 n=1 Tax=Dissostichus eleginoides TaxID=100907 RepID=A0AAD9B2A4_DISEL|nr:Mitofusin-2 [Dissostichus eleginoides]